MFIIIIIIINRTVPFFVLNPTIHYDFFRDYCWLNNNNTNTKNVCMSELK